MWIGSETSYSIGDSRRWGPSSRGTSGVTSGSAGPMGYTSTPPSLGAIHSACCTVRGASGGSHEQEIGDLRNTADRGSSWLVLCPRKRSSNRGLHRRCAILDGESFPGSPGGALRRGVAGVSPAGSRDVRGDELRQDERRPRGKIRRREDVGLSVGKPHQPACLGLGRTVPGR